MEIRFQSSINRFGKALSPVTAPRFARSYDVGAEVDTIFDSALASYRAWKEMEMSGKLDSARARGAVQDLFAAGTRRLTVDFHQLSTPEARLKALTILVMSLEVNGTQWAKHPQSVDDLWQRLKVAQQLLGTFEADADLPAGLPPKEKELLAAFAQIFKDMKPAIHLFYARQYLKNHPALGLHTKPEAEQDRIANLLIKLMVPLLTAGVTPTKYPNGILSRPRLSDETALAPDSGNFSGKLKSLCRENPEAGPALKTALKPMTLTKAYEILYCQGPRSMLVPLVGAEELALLQSEESK